MKKKLKFNSKVIHGGQSLEKGYGAVILGRKFINNKGIDEKTINWLQQKKGS